MVERLSDKERQTINENWDNIKNQVLTNSFANIEANDLTIKATKDNEMIMLSIKENGKENIKIDASLNSKLMKFKYYLDKKQTEIKELIYHSSSIIYFIDKYKMQHPIFQKKEKDCIEEESVTEDNIDEIFDNPDINEIIDDNFDATISEEHFQKFKKEEVDISDYYDEFSSQEYSKLAKIIEQQLGKKKIISKERTELIQFITNLDRFSKKKIIILAGAQKIGISFSIVQKIKCNSILYIDLNTLFNLKRSDKRKYIFIKFMNLFRSYDTYNEFIKENMLALQGYNNIFSIIEDMIPILAKNLGKVIIIIDNYDDYLVGDKKLSNDYLDKLYNIINDTKIKIIFIGRGEYISNLLIDYFYNKTNIKNYILFKYYKSLDLDIENIIHNYYKKENINEIDLYYNSMKKINLEFIILKLITIKKLKNILKDNFRGEFPFQFFRFSLDINEKLSIEYEFDDIMNFSNRKIREYLAKLNNMNNLFKSISPQFKGFIFEELVISIILNNKSSFKNLNFTKKNIIEVEAIYDMNNVEKVNDLDNGPILIIQKTNGEVFDFGIIFDDNNISCFIGGQIGLNKTTHDLKEYQEKICSSHEIIINNINNLTGRKISELKFLIILNKEWQESLQNEYDQKYKKITDYERKIDEKVQLSNYEIEEIKKYKKNISYYNSQYGIKSCDNFNISYLLFSENDFCFYKDGQKVESFNMYQIKSFKNGFELFCIKEYNLIPYNDYSYPILNQKEKFQFLNKLREIFSDIKDIKINYQINGKINLLAPTPENYGILSIYKENKVFTYFDEKFTFFVFKNNKVIKYENLANIIKFPFENDEFIERYFVEFIYEDDDGNNIKDEKDKNNTEIKIDEEDEKKKIEENKLPKKSGKLSKEEQKNSTFENHMKYLQNKRKTD